MNGIFIGKYKGVSIYTDKGAITCLFGWVPQKFDSITACKREITKWLKT